MKIDIIRVNNLASLEGSFEVDFTSEPLKSAGIFAISGPTGSGKSTLLDALCLALYDKTPRFAVTTDNFALKDGNDSSITQSDVRNILRRGSSEGYAEVEFIGVNGHRYRSRWSIRRARNNASGRLQAQEMMVTNLTTGEELQGRKMELLDQLRTVVGLSYEQFTRTVLLAQNDFATFLKSKGADKAELLEKLTGTEIYSLISKEIYNRWRSSEEEVRGLKQIIGVIEILSDETVAELKQTQVQAANLLKTDIEQQTKLGNEIKLVKDYHSKSAELQKKEIALNDANREVAAKEVLLKQKTEEIELFRSNCEKMKPELARAKELDILLKSQLSQRSNAEERLKAVELQQNGVSREVDASKKKVGQCTDSLQNIYTKKGQPLNVATLTDGVLNQLVLADESALSGIQSEHDKLATELNAYNVSEMNELQKRYSEGKTKIEQTVQHLKELQALQDQFKAKHKELDNLLPLKTEKEKELLRLKGVLEEVQLAVSKNVEALRNELKDNEACPVCGSLTHPYHHQNEMVENIYRKVKLEHDATDKENRELDKQLIALKSDLSNINSRIKTLETLLQDFPEDKRDINLFRSEWKALNSAQQELNDKVAKYNLLNEAYKKINATLNIQRAALTNLKDVVGEYKLAQQHYQAYVVQLDSIAKQVAAEREAFAKINDEYQKLMSERQQLLKGKPAAIVEEAIVSKDKALLKELEALRKNRDEAMNLLSLLQGVQKQLTAEVDVLKEKYAEVSEPEKLEVALSEINLKIEALRNSLSSVQARLTQNEENIKKRSLREDELKVKEEKASQWAKLNDLLGSADGKKFKVIAQSYTLNLLLKHANKHLSYLSRRYRLRQIPDSLGLEVVDGDMCDEVRTVYSLSGGESFLISLALALGLSSLSSNSLKVESLFIDEGFGSLDADTLRTAMEALEMLQMQGRKIGVISHVQEMSERIAIQIRLQKGANGKSRIEIVG